MFLLPLLFCSISGFVSSHSESMISNSRIPMFEMSNFQVPGIRFIAFEFTNVGCSNVGVQTSNFRVVSIPSFRCSSFGLPNFQFLGSDVRMFEFSNILISNIRLSIFCVSILWNSIYRNIFQISQCTRFNVRVFECSNFQISDHRLIELRVCEIPNPGC